MRGFSWYLPSILVIKAMSGWVHTCAYYKLLAAEAYGIAFIWSISYWFLGHWNFPKLSPLTIGAGVALLFCILYFFRTFYKYAFCDSPKDPFFLSRWISIPKTYDASPRSFISKFENKNIFVCCSRLTSLLASKISYTYKIKKIYFPFFNFAQTQLSSTFSLNTHLLIVSLNF